MTSLKRGFTLIELLVVIAIIGILSSVVLASLNTARGKGADAAVKSDLDSMRAQAELTYDTGNTYANVCANAIVIKAMTNAAANAGTGISVGTTNAIETTATIACDNASGSWVIQSPLKQLGGYWCVDSSGHSQANPALLAANATVCP